MPVPAFAADAATEKSYLDSRRAAAREQRPPAQSQLTQALQQATAPTDGPAACKQEPSHAPATLPAVPSATASSSQGPDAPTTAVLQRLRPGTQRVPPRVASDPAITPGTGLVGTWSSTTLSTSCDGVCGTTPPLVTGCLTLDFTGKFTSLPPLPCCLRGGLAGSSGVGLGASTDSSSPGTGGLLPLRKSQSALELGGGQRLTPGSSSTLPHSGLWLSTPEGRAYEGGPCTAAERAAKLARYRAKRARRNFQPSIMYASRKALADSRPRIGGRFARSTGSDGGGGNSDGGRSGGCGGAADPGAVVTADDTQDVPMPKQEQGQHPAPSPSSSACAAAAPADRTGGLLAGSSSRSGRGSSTPAAAAPVPGAAASLRSTTSGNKQRAARSACCEPRQDSNSNVAAPAAACYPHNTAAMAACEAVSAGAADVAAAEDPPPTMPPAAAAEGTCSGITPAGGVAHVTGAEDMEVDLPTAATPAQFEGPGCMKSDEAAAPEAAVPGVAAAGGEGSRVRSQASGQVPIATELEGHTLQAAASAPVTTPYSSPAAGAEPGGAAALWLAPAGTNNVQQQLQQALVAPGPHQEDQQVTPEQAPKLRRCGLSGTFSQLRMQGWQAAPASPPTPAASGGHASNSNAKEEGLTPFSRSLPAQWLGRSGSSSSHGAAAVAAAGAAPAGGGGGGLAGSFSSGRLLGSGMKRGSFCLGLDSNWDMQQGAPEQQQTTLASSSSRGAGPDSSASPTSGQASVAAAAAPVPCARASELLEEPPHVSGAAAAAPWDSSQLFELDVGMQWQDAAGQGALENAQPDTYTPGMHSQAGGGVYVGEHPAAPAWGAPASPFAGCALEEGFWDAAAAAPPLSAAAAGGGGEGGHDVMVPLSGSKKGGLKGTFGSFSTLHSAGLSTEAAGAGGGPDGAALFTSSSGPCGVVGVHAAPPPGMTTLAAAADGDFIRDGCLLASAAAAAGDVDELEQALMEFPLAAFDRVLPLCQS